MDTHTDHQTASARSLESAPAERVWHDAVLATLSAARAVAALGWPRHVAIERGIESALTPGVVTADPVRACAAVLDVTEDEEWTRQAVEDALRTRLAAEIIAPGETEDDVLPETPWVDERIVLAELASAN